MSVSGEEAMSMIRKLAVWSTIAALSFSVHARASDVRRVVTGIDADNKSNAILDSKITLAPAPNDLKWAHLWVTDSYPLSISATDTKDKSVGVSPPENGTQFGVVEIPASDPAQPAQPLWHQTRTVDYVVVMSGEIDLMLEASVVHLKAGDTVVQQVTNHAWVNRGIVPCRLLFVLMDAKQPKG
jgi:quercetin dioxygenase-like cupin family protein